jgi:hypothetical protein
MRMTLSIMSWKLNKFPRMEAKHRDFIQPCPGTLFDVPFGLHFLRRFLCVIAWRQTCLKSTSSYGLTSLPFSDIWHRFSQMGEWSKFLATFFAWEESSALCNPPPPTKQRFALKSYEYLHERNHWLSQWLQLYQQSVYKGVSKSFRTESKTK